MGLKNRRQRLELDGHDLQNGCEPHRSNRIWITDHFAEADYRAPASGVAEMENLRQRERQQARVLAYTVFSGTRASPHTKAMSVTRLIVAAYTSVAQATRPGRIACRGCLGGWRMISGSAGSTARASAGTVSVSRLSQRICSGSNGAGSRQHERWRSYP